MYFNYYTFFKITAFVSSTVVFTSFFFEFYYNLEPCKLCLIQRYAWVFFAILCYVAFLQSSFKKLIILLSSLFLALLSLIGIYHSSVEAGIIENFFSCTPSSGLEATSIEELNQIIMNTKNNDCAFPKFTLYGLTLANFGTLASFFLFTLNLLLIKKVLSKYHEY